MLVTSASRQLQSLISSHCHCATWLVNLQVTLFQPLGHAAPSCACVCVCVCACVSVRVEWGGPLCSIQVNTGWLKCLYHFLSAYSLLAASLLKGWPGGPCQRTFAPAMTSSHLVNFTASTHPHQGGSPGSASMSIPGDLSTTLWGSLFACDRDRACMYRLTSRRDLLLPEMPACTERTSQSSLGTAEQCMVFVSGQVVGLSTTAAWMEQTKSLSQGLNGSQRWRSVGLLAQSQPDTVRRVVHPSNGCDRPSTLYMSRQLTTVRLTCDTVSSASVEKGQAGNAFSRCGAHLRPCASNSSKLQAGASVATRA